MEPFVIDQTRRERRRQYEEQRPQLQLPVPPNYRAPEPKPGSVVIVIEY